MTSLIPNPQSYFTDNNGKPLVGGNIYTYIPGSFTEATTWQDINLQIPNSNPIILDTSGRALIWGNGLYRFIVLDQYGNQIYDDVTAACLLSSAISSVLIGPLQAQSLQQFRDLTGTTQAIQSALNNIQLLSGPTGVQGIQGVTGPTGPAGAAQGGYSPSLNASNPGFLTIPNINSSSFNFFLQFGSATTGGNGQATVVLPQAYPNAILSAVASPIIELPVLCSIMVTKNASYLSVATWGIGFSGYLGSVTFDWMTVGY